MEERLWPLYSVCTATWQPLVTWVEELPPSRSGLRLQPSPWRTAAQPVEELYDGLTSHCSGCREAVWW